MGYKKYVLEGIASIAPEGISGELDEIIINQLSKEHEGTIDKNIGLIIAVTELIEHDIGEIIPGDPNVFFKVKFSVITYLPRLHEIVNGVVTQATDFGAFLKIGPVEGLCHVSQVMDDFNSYNGELPGFMGKESKQTLVIEDLVLTRIANVSLKGTVADTKIGLTMRQFGLGKPEWQTSSEKKRKKISKEGKENNHKRDLNKV